MWVSSSASSVWKSCPWSRKPARSVFSVEAGPESISTLAPSDSMSTAAIERGLPVQFRSMVVIVVISSAVYQLIPARWRAEFQVAEQGFACGILGAWLRLLTPRFVFILLTRPEHRAIRAGEPLCFAVSETKMELRRLPLRSSYRVNAVMSGKSYDEFMEEVYASGVCSNCCGGALGVSTL